MEEKLDIEQTLFNLSNGNEEALKTLFNYYYPRLYRFAKSFLKIEEGIDDILQEVFIKIWKNRKKVNRPETFNAYIYTISRNLLLNELRHRLNEQKALETIYKKSVAEEYLLSKEIDFQELNSKINEIIQHLPESHREYFILSRRDGLSYKNIAIKMAVSEKTVEYHISQAKKILKSKLKKLGIFSLLYIYLFL